jgi:hypothetical protein
LENNEIAQQKTEIKRILDQEESVEHDQNSDNEQYIYNIDHKEIDDRFGLLEEQVKAIIETVAQLEENVAKKEDLNDIVDILGEKSNTDDVSKAIEDIYKILEEKYLESP